MIQKHCNTMRSPPPPSPLTLPPPPPSSSSPPLLPHHHTTTIIITTPPHHHHHTTTTTTTTTTTMIIIISSSSSVSINIQGRQSWEVEGVATPRFWAGGRGVVGNRGSRVRVVKYYYILSCTLFVQEVCSKVVTFEEK